MMQVLETSSEQQLGSRPSSTLVAKLERAVPALEAVLARDSPLIARFRVLLDRLLRNRIQIAVLGQFKRGKSSFINALLGVPLLPIAVVPLTAVPIFISWGPSGLARVRFRGDRPAEEFTLNDPDAIRAFLFRFVAEEANSENHLGVARVDLFYPAPILVHNAVLIDTPGVGSTFRHNTEAALETLPECDAALFVVSADPPITEAELEYLRRLKSVAAKIVFVLNKVDYVQLEERTRMIDFLRDVLKQNGLWLSGTNIFSVSARDGLEAKRRGDQKELEASGFPAIEAYLADYMATEKTQTLAQAIAGKAGDILAQAIMEVDLRINALTMPLDKLSSKARAFEHALRSIEEQRRVIHDLLAGEQCRLVTELKFWTDSLYQDVCKALSGVVHQNLTGVSWTEHAQNALSSAMETAFNAARDRFVGSFASNANAAFSAHQRRFDRLVGDVRRTAANIFNIPFRGGSEESLFALTNDPYWVTRHIEGALIPDPSRFFDRLLPAKLRRARLRERIIKKTNALVLRNASNLNWAILQSLNDTFRKAGAQFEDRLDDAIRATGTVIDAALARRREEAFEVDPEIARLDSLKATLRASREAIAGEQRGRVNLTGGDARSASEHQLG